MIQISNIVLVLIALFAVGYMIGEIVLQIAEGGYRVGYDHGLEDGIRMTNEVLFEEGE